MAKTTSGRTFTYTDIVADIRAGRLAPVYLLQGDEPYYIDKLVSLLSEKVIPDKDARDFDSYNFFGADDNVKSVIDTARQFPVMGERLLVMLREAQVMHNARNELEKIAPYAKSPSATTVLVIAFKGDVLKSTSSLVKGIKLSGGVVFDSMKVKDWQLSSLIEGYCKEQRVAIDRKAVEMLKDYIGADLSRLFGEIDKLLLANNRAPITPESIERNIGISKDYNNFELISALANRNYAKCMKIVDYFERNPKQNPVVMTVSLLFRFFANIMQAHYSPDKTERGLMANLGFHSPYKLKEISLGMRGFSARSCLSIIHELRLLDCKSKGINSLQKDYSLLKEFIYRAFTL